MDQVRAIYKKNFLIAAGSFVIVLFLPYATELARWLMMALALTLYVYLGYMMVKLAEECMRPATSLERLRFLYITIGLFFASGYFFLAAIDSGEEMIKNVRVFCSTDCSYPGFDGFSERIQETTYTYLNALYYSIVVMTTLGDSKITVEGGLARPLVAAEVLMSIGMTVFKLAQYYNDMASKEARSTEDRLVREIRAAAKNREAQKSLPVGGFLSRLLAKFRAS